MPKFSVYQGQFFCQRCNSKVREARFYYETFDFTWMCDSKHLSKVNLWVRGY